MGRVFHQGRDDVIKVSVGAAEVGKGPCMIIPQTSGHLSLQFRVCLLHHLDLLCQIKLLVVLPQEPVEYRQTETDMQTWNACR